MAIAALRRGSRATKSGFSMGSAAFISYAASGCVLAVSLSILREVWPRTLWFDDAFMFYRYANNMRHGLGMSWNLDGVHTYGETAPLWGLVVYALSFLPLTASQVLQFGSWLSSLAAFAGTAWAVSVNAEHVWMTSMWRVLGAVALPLALQQNYRGTAFTGMETMLGMALCAVFVGATLRWSRGAGRPEAAAMWGLLLFLTRPEAGLVVLLFPPAVTFLLRRGNGAGLARLLGTFLAGVVLDLVIAKRYFRTALPLSFYMKSAGGYEGYAKYWHPTVALLTFMAGLVPFLLLLVWLSRKEDGRMLLAFAVPLICLAVYLDRVLQIMNTFGRYYLPYTPLIVVPALLLLDRRLSRKAVQAETPPRQGWKSRTLRLSLGAAVLLLLVPALRVNAGVSVDRLTQPAQYAYDPVELRVEAHDALPWYSTVELWETVPKLLFAGLPPGATIASSEVGYVGASTPQANVIDLEGLNDTDIALQGFSMARLLARRPDVIWMPHPDYTWQRGVMLSDPQFLAQYEVVAEAAGSGIAIRRAGPYRELLDANMKALWSELYPGVAMESYVVKGASWTGRKHPVQDRGEQ